MASGIQLDRIGEKVGEPRQGFDDAAYRLHLKARILLNYGDGTTEDLIRLFTVLLGDAATVTITEFFPAAITVVVRGLPIEAAVADYYVKFLGLAKAAGVKSILEWLEYPEADSFGFAGAPGKGFNEGYFASGRYA